MSPFPDTFPLAAALQHSPIKWQFYKNNLKKGSSHLWDLMSWGFNEKMKMWITNLMSNSAPPFFLCWILSVLQRYSFTYFAFCYITDRLLKVCLWILCKIDQQKVAQNFKAEEKRLKVFRICNQQSEVFGMVFGAYGRKGGQMCWEFVKEEWVKSQCLNMQSWYRPKPK